MIFSPEEYSSQNHGCTLNTITNIEQFIFENSGKYSKTELWAALPKKIMYQSYKVVIEFLLFSGKIRVENRKVVWNNFDLNFDLSTYNAQNHAPTLTTITNILEFVSKNSNIYSKTELWNALPKKIMYQSYKVILEYLLISGLLKIEGRKVIFIGGENK